MSQAKRVISIWYFIGLLLVVYGVLITGAGLYEFISPASHPVVLWEAHAGVWWGALMLALGVAYVYLFRPGRKV